MRALVAIDGSGNALRAVRYLIDHHDLFRPDAELLLVNVHRPVPSSRVKAMVGQEAIDIYYREEAEAALAPARAMLAGTAWRVTERRIVGQPVTEIIAAAQQAGCDLIVMGTQGRSALGDLLMGSVATRVIATSPIPVLSIR